MGRSLVEICTSSGEGLGCCLGTSNRLSGDGLKLSGAAGRRDQGVDPISETTQSC